MQCNFPLQSLHCIYFCYSSGRQENKFAVNRKITIPWRVFIAAFFYCAENMTKTYRRTKQWFPFLVQSNFLQPTLRSSAPLLSSMKGFDHPGTDSRPGSKVDKSTEKHPEERRSTKPNLVENILLLTLKNVSLSLMPQPKMSLLNASLVIISYSTVPSLFIIARISAISKSRFLLFSDAESICKGTASAVFNHSPLKALISQLLSSVDR